MQKHYNHKEVEPRVNQMWEQGNYFTPKIDRSKKPFSIFLVPPNASGGMHIGNVLMIAIQDILARYHRAKGEPTLWIPSTDHGGYETQVTFERELEKAGKSRFDYRKTELFSEIEKFVERNNSLIKSQIKASGASVDWSRFCYTMDEGSIKAVNTMFRKMIADDLIVRRPYMVNYCFSCGTVLADIELKEVKEQTPLYAIKFEVEKSDEYLTLTTTRPEFLFAVTHVLVHPADDRFACHIGKVLKNPVTGEPVEVIASKRKFDPQKLELELAPFCPSYVRYDYEYTLRNKLPSRNLLDWDGKMLERYPGLTPIEARGKEVEFLEKAGKIESVDTSYQGSVFLCKRGHKVESVIMFTWFLRLDDEKRPLRKPAIEAVESEKITIYPRWRKKGLIEWLGKMHDWPIARQNVWGIKIPVWYDVSDPSKFTIWFTDRTGTRCYGNLKNFLERGITLDEISSGLERIYAEEGSTWTLEKETGKKYLPETDTFDTWFGDSDIPDSAYFSPIENIVLGHDLLRLSVSLEIMLSVYMTGKPSFHSVYLHRLIKGADGQKMSKSLGNAVSLDFYFEKFGADVTRMALISYTSLPDDFVFSEERLVFYQKFSNRLWNMGWIISLIEKYSHNLPELRQLSFDDKQIVEIINRLTFSVGSYLEKYQFAFAQEKLCFFLTDLEKYAGNIDTEIDSHISLSVLRYVYLKYLILLHPFMPFITEELHRELDSSTSPLAITSWPNNRRV